MSRLTTDSSAYLSSAHELHREFSEGSHNSQTMLQSPSIVSGSRSRSSGMAPAVDDSTRVGQRNMKQTNPLQILLIATFIWFVQVALCWVSGFRDHTINQAIEQGVVEIDHRERLNFDATVASSKREVQRSTTSFWRMLIQLNDYLLEPGVLWLRLWIIPSAIAAASLLAGHALSTDQIRQKMAQYLLIVVPRPGLELLIATTGGNQASHHLGLNLLLPNASFVPVGLYQALAQIDIFWLASTICMTVALYRMRGIGKLPLFSAVTLCFIAEWLIRVGLAILVGAAMRETLIPAEPFRVGRGPGP